MSAFDHIHPLEYEGAADAMRNLARLGEGLHSCGWFGGWIEVKKIIRSPHDGWEVLWLSGKEAHNSSWYPAISVEYLDGHIKNVFKSISMLFVHERPDRIHWADWLAKKIAKATKRKRAKPTAV